MRNTREHFHLSFDVPMGSLPEMTAILAARPGDTAGPTTFDSRYVTEDVPFGLVPTLRLAELSDVTVPNDILPALVPLDRALLSFSR